MLAIRIKIQSFSDIVTNSSSEIFTVYSKNTKDELLNLLKEVHKKFSYSGTQKEYDNLPKKKKEKYDYITGDGGRIDIYNFDDRYNRYLKYYIPENKRKLFTKEMFSLHRKESIEDQEKIIEIYIDRGFIKTLDWAIENLYVTAIYDRNYVINEEGRILKLLPYYENSYVVDKNGNKK